jgi:Fur family ferric uptake transcriptional regulator
MAQHVHPPDPEAMALGPRPRALLIVLREANTELSGQLLHDRLEQGSQRLGLASVHQNLRLHQRLGLVRYHKAGNGESVYASLERDDYHLTCMSCGHCEPLPICPSGTRGLGRSCQQSDP